MLTRLLKTTLWRRMWPGDVFHLRTARSAVGTLLMNAAAIPLSLAVSLVFARLLGASEYGAYAYAWAWILFLGVFATAGLDQLLVRQVAAYLALARRDLLLGLRQWADRLGLTTSVLIGGALLLVLELLPARVDPAMRAALGVAAFVLPLLVLNRLRRSTMHGFRRVVLGSLPETIVHPLVMLIGAALAFGLLHARADAVHALTLVVIASAVTLVLTAVLVERTARSARSDRGDYADRSAWLRSALPLMLVSGMYLISARVDTLMLGTMRAPREVGLYALANRGAEMVLFPLQAINMTVAPAIATLYTEGERFRLQQLLTLAARAATAIAIPAVLLFVFFPAPVLGLFGPQFRDGAPVLVILSLAQMVDVVCGPVGLLLIMTGHERITARVVAVTTVLNVILNASLIPFFGGAGAAAATACSIVTRNVSLVFAVRRRLRFDSTALGRPVAADAGGGPVTPSLP